ncbi:MAG: MoaD/ThiS family protein [Rhodomicrobiaceae bacterium]
MPDAEASLALPTVEVLLPRALVDLFPGAPRRLELAAPTVAAMIDELDMRWPGMADRLRDSSPRIRRHLNIFVAGRRASLETQLAAGTQVYILTAMSGG